MSQLPMGWQVKCLGEVLQKTAMIDPRKNPEQKFEYIDVSSVSRNTFSIEKTSLLKGKDAPSRARRQVKTGDVLFATIRPTLQRVAIVPNALNGEVCSTGYFVLRPREEIENRFLYYYLFTEKFMFEMERRQKGASYPAVNDGDVKDQLIFFPPLPEQKRIVSILDETFAGITQAVAIAEKNIANARKLFESYLNSVFTKKGEGWEESSLGKSCDFYNGKAHEKNIDANGQFIVINSKFISSGGHLFKKTNDELFPLHKDDIVMVMSDVPNGKALAKCFLVGEDGKYTLNQRICCIRSERFVKRFLFYHLNRHPFLLSFNNGENQTNLRKDDILRCPLYIPETNEQRKIADLLDGFLLETQHLGTIYQQKLTALTELKQSILQKAFAGELTADVVSRQVVTR